MSTPEFRLVVDRRITHPHLGATTVTLLQTRESESHPWKTVPIVNYTDLCEVEQNEILKALKT